MTKSEQIVVESVHELGIGKTVAARVDLYRAHASTTARTAVAKHLFECADEFEAAELRCRQLVLNFKSQAEG